MTIDINALKMKVAELEESIEKSIPGYVGILGVIHKELQTQPELLYMLKDEEIATIINSLAHHHHVEIVQVKEKKPITKKTGATLDENSV